jgi:acetyl-CoA synthetase
MRIFEKYAKANFTSYEDFKALFWTNDHGVKRIFSFSEMKRLSDKAANYLSSLGIGKGDMVMIILKRDWQFWYTIMALHKLGAVTIPATHLLTAKDITYRVNAAGVKAIICTDSGEIKQHVDGAKDVPTLQLKLLCGDREGWLNYDKGVEDASDQFVKPAPDKLPQPGDIMLLYFTSGTTGMPKMVAQSYTYPLGHIPTAVFWHNADPDGMHLTVSETGWAKSVWGKLYGQWLAETAIFVYDHEKFVPAEMLKAICDNKVTTFCAPPTVYRYFIKEDLTKYDFSHMKWATTAGEPLNPEVFHQFEKATGLRLYEIYGQTELTVTVGTFIWMKPKPGSMGKPSPLFDVDIVDEDGNPSKWGEPGEIVVRTGKGVSPGMFMGYYKDPELTQKVWHDGLYHTGDVAWKDEEGYYWYVGRTDDVIKSSGYRIGPFEVESALMEHPAVLETAITGVPPPERGQIVKATIVLAKGYAPSEALKKELQEHVKRVTAPYKYPREIEFVTELPKTISGKIRRVEIRAKDQGK